jgi:hypothetical protein
LVRDVELHTGAAYVIMERKISLYRRILLGMVSGESRARRGNVLRKVPVARLGWYRNAQPRSTRVNVTCR